MVDGVWLQRGHLARLRSAKLGKVDRNSVRRLYDMVLS